MVMTHLAEKVIQYYEDFDSFLEWIQKFDDVGIIKVEIIDLDRKHLFLNGKIRTEIYDSLDPINSLVLLGLVFFGEYYVFMNDTKRAFNMVNKWWKKHLEKKKNEKNKEEV